MVSNLGEELKNKGLVEGRVIAPGDSAFDDARSVFYGWINRRPGAIVKVANETDVSRVVTFARDRGLELAVRSGGHSVAGHSVSEGGIVIDLSDMKKIEFDVARGTAWAETGLTAGQYTAAAGAHGLATGFGDTASVGIGGITLGGGVGFLVRKYGLTVDNLLAADVAAADGQILRTDAENHPDLFWAIRGGGGNFGVATRFKFRLQKVSDIVGGILMLAATPEVVRGIIVEAESAPEELSVIANVMPAPPMPFIPQEQHGKLIIMAMMVYAGPAEAGERAVAPIRGLAKPIADMVKPMKYPQMFEGPEGPHPAAVAFHSMFIDTIDQRAAETIVGHIQASKASMAVAQLRVLGGAVARVPAEATAYAHRKRRIMVNIAALYERREEANAHNAWVDGFSNELRQGDPDVYVNFLGEEGEARVRAAYPGSTWDRLASVKRRYDPSNFFRLNQNIPPK